MDPPFPVPQKSCLISSIAQTLNAVHLLSKVVDSILKNHKPFFINIGNYRDISVQIRQVSAHFRPVKFWSRDGRSQTRFALKHL